MGLAAGSRLGPYEILSLLGAGGMGEVYRARDTRLGRDVAVKVLPELFATDPDRVARFQREAQLLASLNHPNIAIIHGLEDGPAAAFAPSELRRPEEAGPHARALVMELVEGPTLADRIAQGPLPLEEALPIARQIAEALEAAHERGVIHRDLKPANIKVTPDGKVKVLDFGLAKLVEAGGARGAGVVGGAEGLSMSPTLSVHGTYAGVILGTAAYMSPEQARGKPVDRRTDIWAFGCVLFEMLTGKQVFDAGETVSDAVAAILKNEPEWNALPAETPPHIRTLLRRCLHKDPQKRLPHIGVARIEIDEGPMTAGGSTTQDPPYGPGGSRGRALNASAWRRALPWVAAAVSLGVASVAMAMWAPWRTVPRPTARLEVGLGTEASLAAGLGAPVILSPDGTTLAFIAQTSPQTQPMLYIRRLDQLTAMSLPGTEGAADPFFSPDGQWVAFFAGGRLKKMSVTGGAAVTLADSPSPRGGFWAEDGTIVFQPVAGAGGNLLRISAAGGQPVAVTTLREGEATHRWAQVLPGGKALLYTASPVTTGYNDAVIMLQPLPGGTPKVLLSGGYFGKYLRSGHVVFMRDGTLFAVPFDLDGLEVTGEPLPVLEGVRSSVTTGGGHFAASDTGTLVYVRGPQGGALPIHWMDREKTTPLRKVPADWSNPSFAPDGRRLALDIHDGKQLDVWVYEWARDTMSRLTFDPGDDALPVWTPDGRRIVYTSTRGGPAANLYWQRADGTGAIDRLTESEHRQLPGSWHPGGRFFAFVEYHPQTLADLMVLPIEGNEAAGWKPGKPIPFLNSPFIELLPVFSPDGRWLAYFSNETGRNEVYVRPFPGPGGKWQVSTDGGVDPIWSRTRQELFYETSDQRLMVVPYAVEGESLRLDRPRLWSEGRFVPTRQKSFDLHPDGQRFAIAPLPETQTTGPANPVLVFNFFDELRRIAPSQ